MESDASHTRLYLPQLDTLRFFAFLTVFCVHVLPAVLPSAHHGAGWLVAVLEHGVQRAGVNGVALFFLLSAFLITRLLFAERERTGTISIRNFLLRRWLRIWPLYFLILAIGLLGPLSLPMVHLSSGQVAAACFFVLNWNFVLHGFSWNPIYPLWTVSCEEQFYIVWPGFVRHMPVARFRWACAAMAAAVLVLAFFPYGHALQADAIGEVDIFVFFPLGGVLALRSLQARQPWRLRWSVLVGGTGLLLWWGAGMVDLLPSLQGHGRITEMLVLMGVGPGTVMIFEAWYRASRIRWPGVLVYLGKISYGLYAFHVPCIMLVTWLLTVGGVGIRTGAGHSGMNLVDVLGLRVPLSLLATVTLAAISYRYYESPFLHLKERFAVVPSRPV